MYLLIVLINLADSRLDTIVSSIGVYHLTQDTYTRTKLKQPSTGTPVKSNRVC